MNDPDAAKEWLEKIKRGLREIDPDIITVEYRDRDGRTYGAAEQKDILTEDDNPASADESATEGSYWFDSDTNKDRPDPPTWFTINEPDVE